MVEQSVAPVKIFCSYSSEDESCFKEFKKHLGSLVSQKKITVWDDTKIKAGELWDTKIQKNLKSSDMILFLLSPDFVASEYCNRELELGKELRKEHDVALVGIYLKSCLYQGLIGDTQCVPKGENWVGHEKEEANRNKLWTEIVKDIEEKVDEILKNRDPNDLNSFSWDVQTSKNCGSIIESPESFIGREETVKWLHDITTKSKCGGIIVYGLFGNGKSTVVRYFAYKACQNNDFLGGIAYINFEQEDFRIYEKFLRQILYHLMGTPSDKFEIKECEQRLEDHLETSKCLIVIDKIRTESINEKIVHWLKSASKKSHILLVANYKHDLIDDFKGKSIHGLKSSDAEILFQQCWPEKTDISDKGIISDICKEVNYSPFLIEKLVNKYSHLDLREFVKKVKDYDFKKRSKDDKMIIRFWEDEIDKIYEDRLDDDAKEILNLCSLLNGEVSSFYTLSEISDVPDWQSAVKKCIDYDLLEKGRRKEDKLKKEEHKDHMISRSYFAAPLVRKKVLQKIDNEERLKSVSLRLACLAEKQAEIIEPANSDDNAQEVICDALDWFDIEWRNLYDCAMISCENNDIETFFKIVDSVLQFMIRRGHLKDCENLYIKALDKRQDTWGQAVLHNDLGVCFQFQSDFEKACKHYNESIKLQQEVLKDNKNDKRRHKLPKTYNSLGFTLQQQGKEKYSEGKPDEAKEKYINAEKKYAMALDLCRDIIDQKDRDGVDDKVIKEIKTEYAQTYNNLGWLYTRKFEEDKSTSSFNEANKNFKLSEERKSDDDSRYGQLLNRWGELHRLRGELHGLEGSYDEAKKYYLKSLKKLSSIAYRFELGVSYMGLGIIHEKERDYGEAKKNYEESLKCLNDEYRYSEERCRVLERLGELCKQLGEKCYDEIQDELRKARKAKGSLKGFS